MSLRIYILLVLAMFAVSTSPIIARYLDHLSPITIALWRMVIAAFIMSCYGYYRYDFKPMSSSNHIKIIIAGAGGAAHLPGMIASLSPLPVIGVPIKSRNSIDGWDSILSILQMPGGVPVATVALNGAKNAGILAAKIIGTKDKDVQNKIIEYKSELKNKVIKDSIK